MGGGGGVDPVPLIFPVYLDWDGGNILKNKMSLYVGILSPAQGEMKVKAVKEFWLRSTHF